MFKDRTPDFSFVVIENNSNKPNFLSFSYQGGSNNPSIINSRNKTVGGRLKANGNMWTPLEINNLMADSLEILAPMGNLVEVPASSSVDNDFGAYPFKGASPDEYYPSGIWFSPDFPEFLLPKEQQNYDTPPQVPRNAITWGVVRMEPGTMSGPPFRGTQEVRPRFREYIAVFGDTTKQYIIENTSTQIARSGRLLQFLKLKGQHYDMLVQYNIWSKSNYEVELLTHWFLNYISNYRGMFRESGVQNMFLWSRVRDDTMIQMKNGYHVRSVLYYFRTEEVNIESVGPINRINLNIDVDSLLPAEKGNDYLNHAESQQKILDKWMKYA